MAIQKSTGIVLARKDLRETSLILTIYTRDFGKIRGIVRGVRGPRGQYGGSSLEIFVYDEIVFYERRKSDLYTISQCDLIDFFNPIREELARLAYAAYMVELLDSVTPLADPNKDVFELLLNSLMLLSGSSSAKRVTRIFEIKLLALLGLMPSFDICVTCSKALGANSRFSFRHGGLICGSCFKTDPNSRAIMPGTAKFIEHVRGVRFEKVARIKVSREVGKELEEILRSFLDYHIERQLEAVKFLAAIKE